MRQEYRIQPDISAFRDFPTTFFQNTVDKDCKMLKRPPKPVTIIQIFYLQIALL